MKEKEERKKQIEEMQRQKEAVALATAQNRLLHQQCEFCSRKNSVTGTTAEWELWATLPNPISHFVIGAGALISPQHLEK